MNFGVILHRAGNEDSILTLADIAFDDAAALLRGLVGTGGGARRAPIPGSYWGEPGSGHHRRAGLCAAGYAGALDAARSLSPDRAAPERACADASDATDSIAEEDATCYLQIVLAETVAGRWEAPDGRHGRLGLQSPGSAQAWFEQRCRGCAAVVARNP